MGEKVRQNASFFFLIFHKNPLCLNSQSQEAETFTEYYLQNVHPKLKS